MQKCSLLNKEKCRERLDTGSIVAIGFFSIAPRALADDFLPQHVQAHSLGPSRPDATSKRSILPPLGSRDNPEYPENSAAPSPRIVWLFLDAVDPVASENIKEAAQLLGKYFIVQGFLGERPPVQENEGVSRNMTLTRRSRTARTPQTLLWKFKPVPNWDGVKLKFEIDCKFDLGLPGSSHLRYTHTEDLSLASLGYPKSRDTLRLDIIKIEF